MSNARSRTGTVVLTGFMGAGKSTLGAKLEQVLDQDMVDVDGKLEDEIDGSIGEFFAREGESRFREIEERLTLEALDRGGIVALGGGAIESQKVRDALASHLAVWCSVGVDTAWQRVQGSDRPLATDNDKFSKLFATRRPFYEEVARAVVSTDGDNLNDLDVDRFGSWITRVRFDKRCSLVWARSESTSSKPSEYPVVIGDGAVRKLEPTKRWFVVADRLALSHHRRLLPDALRREPLLEFDATELIKTRFLHVEEILDRLVENGASPDDGVVAFGGGVVGDLTGLCAALFHRGGMDLVQAPTTLLAQVDSAYGGKTGVNLRKAKHVVGQYYMPKAVLADPTALRTLPAEELSSGFAEVVKTGLIAGGALWDRVRRVEDLRSDDMQRIVFDCARTKIDVVASDERDQGRRAVLNLGHTVGHAIEVATLYEEYRHGEAVALGLLAALRLSDADALREEVRDIFDRHGLPTSLKPSVDTELVMEAIEHDKKRLPESSRAPGQSPVAFVLVNNPGEPRVGRPVKSAALRAAVEELKSSRR